MDGSRPAMNLFGNSISSSSAMARSLSTLLGFKWSGSGGGTGGAGAKGCPGDASNGSRGTGLGISSMHPSSCAGHSKCTQWKTLKKDTNYRNMTMRNCLFKKIVTSLAVFCVPTILTYTTGCGLKLMFCQDWQGWRLRSHTVTQSRLFVETST